MALKLSRFSARLPSTPALYTQVHVWDLRSPSTPLATELPGMSVLNMKANPEASCLAVVTGECMCPDASQPDLP